MEDKKNGNKAENKEGNKTFFEIAAKIASFCDTVDKAAREGKK